MNFAQYLKGSTLDLSKDEMSLNDKGFNELLEYMQFNGITGLMFAEEDVNYEQIPLLADNTYAQKNLTKLSIAKNFLTDTQAVELSKLTALRNLDISGNQITKNGFIDQIFAKLPELQTAIIHDNHLCQDDVMKIRDMLQLSGRDQEITVYYGATTSAL
jgi:Leucine-rich repeat (LRR) protein